MVIGEELVKTRDDIEPFGKRPSNCSSIPSGENTSFRDSTDDKSIRTGGCIRFIEVVKQGLSREIHEYQSMPLSKYAELIDFLIDNKDDYIIIGKHKGTDMNFTDADVEDMFYNIGSSKATIVFVEVYNAKREFIGMIGITFDSEVSKAKFLELRSNSALDQLLVELRSII